MAQHMLAEYVIVICFKYFSKKKTKINVERIEIQILWVITSDQTRHCSQFLHVLTDQMLITFL